MQPQGAGDVDALQWRFLISGMAASSSRNKDLANPDPSWIEPNVWSEIVVMSGLPVFAEFPAKFTENLSAWKEVFDSVEPQNVVLPAPYDGLMEGSLQRMCILRCLRRDKMMEVSKKHDASQFFSPSLA